MLFHKFNTQDERRNFGGSCFIEMQFCKLPFGSDIKKIVNDVDHWQNDSLYIADENTFYNEYKSIFDCGIYHNLQTGIVDIYGLNYYSLEQIDGIIKKIVEIKPMDYETLINWLKSAKEHNGFYILGI